MAQLYKDGSSYIGYEYKEKVIPRSLCSLYQDSYPCFGWQEDPNGSSSDRQPTHSGHVTLHFRRDRKLCNRTELTRLQRNFDACVAEIEQLEDSKTTLPTMWALLVGLLGCAFMACSVFAVTAEPPRLLLSIVLAVPGFAGWILPYFLYKALVRRRTAQVSVLIEEKYDEIYTICEKGSSLLL